MASCCPWRLQVHCVCLGCLFLTIYIHTDNMCDYYKTCYACTIPQPYPKVTLRGLCANSPYDKTYSYDIDRYGHTVLQGDSSTLIFYNITLRTWVLWSVQTKDKYAISRAHQYSLMLGAVKFDFKDVSSYLCGMEEDNSEHVVKLTTCGEDMFTCDDGRCIDIEDRCDDKTDCIDGSDENRCKKVVMNSQYKKHVPPFMVDQEGREKIPVDVKISFSIEDILR